MDSKDKITLQAVISGEARKALYETGRLVGDRSRICFEDFEPAYEWMSEKMLERLKSPPTGVEAWPVWAWYQKTDTGRVDPNDEEYSGQDLWVITFEADRDQVVLSRFGDWHFVLNGWYLPDQSVLDEGQAEDDAFCKELEDAGVDWGDRPYPEPFWKRVTDSWMRIFDLPTENSGEGVQATFWVLNASQIISEEPCIGTVSVPVATGLAASSGDQRPDF